MTVDHIYTGFKDEELVILQQFQNDRTSAEPAFITDFIGIRTRTASVPGAAALDNMALGLPIPACFHAETVEWIGALKSVASARDRFVVMELGAGWGTWCVGCAVAARSRGVGEIRMYAVEGDLHHFTSMEQHFRDNGFDPGGHMLLHAVVGVAAGTARWPKVEDSSGEWDLRPMPEDQSDYRGRKHLEFVEVPAVPMADLMKREPAWDLVHIDVQGDEVDLCRSCLDLLNERACWIVVGTHSRKLDGDLLDMMFHAGWVLENEKPTRFTFLPGVPTLEGMVQVDGTQVWRNPRLRSTSLLPHPNTFFLGAATLPPRCKLISGWSYPELGDGVWTIGDEAFLELTLVDLPRSGELMLRIDAVPFLHGRRTSRRIDIFINDTFIASPQLTSTSSPKIALPIDATLLREESTLTFKVENPERPIDFVASGDTRQIGLKIRLISLE